MKPDDCREAFEKWYIDHAKAPIDPWHKEFAWSVWQAAQSRPTDEQKNIAVGMIHPCHAMTPPQKAALAAAVFSKIGIDCYGRSADEQKVSDDITDALIGYDELCNVSRERIRDMCQSVLTAALQSPPVQGDQKKQQALLSFDRLYDMLSTKSENFLEGWMSTEDIETIRAAILTNNNQETENTHAE